MSATLADVARATGMSISTVSRVLTQAPAASRMSAATRDKIAHAAERLGYRPNLLARSLRTQKTNTMAMIVSDIANPWFGLMASMVEQALHRHGYSVIVCNSCEDAELEREYLRLLPRKGIDALMLVPIASRREQIMEHIPADLPLVIIDRPVKGIASSVATDQQQAASLLCRELTRVGVKKVGLIHGPGHIITHRLRADAVRSCFEVVASHQGPAQKETGNAGCKLLRGRDFDALICTNNAIAEGAIEAMSLQSEAKVPIIAVFDGLPMMEFLRMPIVSCDQDVEKLATSAVAVALEQMNGGGGRSVILDAGVNFNRAFAELRGR